MAYARFVFPKGLEVLKKLKEIVRFATGQISSTSDLHFAYPGLTDIIIIDQPGWSLVSQAFEPDINTATYSSYRLTAPCVNPAKNKCILIDTRTARSMSDSSDAGGSTFVAPSSSATDGYVDFFLGTSWTGTTLNNRIPAITLFGTDPYAALYTWGTSLLSDVIYVFSSARKLIIFSPEDSGVYQIEAVLEFPETHHANKHNNIPVLSSSFYRSDLDAGFHINPITGSVSTSSDGLTSYFKHNLVDWYNNELNTRSHRSLSSYGINNIEFFTTPHLTISSSGQGSFPLIPLTDIRIIYGEGVHNYSELTDFYITYRDTYYVGFGDRITVNDIEYTIVQVGNSYSDYRAYAIKRG